MLIYVDDGFHSFFSFRTTTIPSSYPSRWKVCTRCTPTPSFCCPSPCPAPPDDTRTLGDRASRPRLGRSFPMSLFWFFFGLALDPVDPVVVRFKGFVIQVARFAPLP